MKKRLAVFLCLLLWCGALTGQAEEWDDAGIEDAFWEIPEETAEEAFLEGDAKIWPEGEDAGFFPEGDEAVFTAGPLEEEPLDFYAEEASVPWTEEGPVPWTEESGYQYELVPLLEPFNEWFYVRTENPDPKSFRFVDESSRFRKEDASGEQGVLSHSEVVFADVVYEDEGRLRVKGGYLFRNKAEDLDGGELRLQEKGANDAWKDKGAVNCPAVVSSEQYLLDTYTDASMGFFEKLDAVQRGLNRIALYPWGLFDTAEPDPNHPYPFLTSSPYAELELNRHYEVYLYSEKEVLVSFLYPFVLSSLGFPGTMWEVAEMLDPSCQVESGEEHWQVVITLGGTSKTYGGAGSGEGDPVYSHLLTEKFLFDGSEADMAEKISLESLARVYRKYEDESQKVREESADLLRGEAFRTVTKGGTWIRIATEPGYSTGDNRSFRYGSSYAYVVSDSWGSSILSDGWVDGRYVGKHETLRLGETFEEHPTSDIVLRDREYTGSDGQTYRNDLLFTYDAGTGTWRAEDDFYKTYADMNTKPLPDEFILTKEEVAAMKPDRNTDKVPEKGKIFDGSALPGTEFVNAALQGISLPETLTVPAGGSCEIPITYIPENAANKTVVWHSDDEDILEFPWGYESSAAAYKPGTVTVTAVSEEGGYTASCLVTVVTRKVKLTEGQRFRLEVELQEGEDLEDVIEDSLYFEDAATGKNVWGEITYDMDVDTVLPAGEHTLHMTFTPDSQLYEPFREEIRITVLAKPVPPVTYKTDYFGFTISPDAMAGYGIEEKEEEGGLMASLEVTRKSDSALAFRFCASASYPVLSRETELIALLRDSFSKQVYCVYAEKPYLRLAEKEKIQEVYDAVRGQLYLPNYEAVEVNAGKLKDWQRKFYSFLMDGMAGGKLAADFGKYPNAKFRLLHLDGDGIPELVCYLKKSTSGIKMISYHGGALHKSTMPYGTIHYVKGKNSFFVQSKLSGVRRDYYYVLKGGVLSPAHKGVVKSQDYSLAGAKSIKWDGKKVKAKNYEALQGAAFDASKERKLPAARTKKEILNYLFLKSYY